jgi:hypothetical protein
MGIQTVTGLGVDWFQAGGRTGGRADGRTGGRADQTIVDGTYYCDPTSLLAPITSLRKTLIRNVDTSPGDTLLYRPENVLLGLGKEAY